MGELVRKNHNVSLLMYHFVFVAKYRRLVITEEVDELLKDICLEISKRYEVRFLEIGTEGDPRSLFDPIGSNLQPYEDRDKGEEYNCPRNILSGSFCQRRALGRGVLVGRFFCLDGG
jgi:hypothetical protein